MSKTKKIIISIIAGIVVGFILGFIIISVWFFKTDLNTITSQDINFLGLNIMNVKNSNGEIVKEINNLSMTVIGFICSIIIYASLTLYNRKIDKRKLNL